MAEIKRRGQERAGQRQRPIAWLLWELRKDSVTDLDPLKNLEPAQLCV